MVKSLPANAGATGAASLIPGPGRSPGGGHGHPPQYSRLEHPTDRGAWRATVHGVARSQSDMPETTEPPRTHTTLAMISSHIHCFTEHSKYFHVLSHSNLYCKKAKGQRGKVFYSGPHRLSVTESALEPSTGDSEASALLATLPLESWGFSTPKAQFHPGDHFPPTWLVIVFMVIWSPCSDWFFPVTKPSFSSLTQPDLLMSQGLFMASILPLSGGVKKGIWSTLAPHSPLYAPGIVAQLREEQKEPPVGARASLGARGKREDGLQNCCAGWGCFSHATFIVLVLLGLNNQE